MKIGPYTTTLTLEIELFSEDGENVEYKEFDVEFTADWQNDGIGEYFYGSQRCFDKGTDYLEDLVKWEIQSEATDEEKKEIKEYIEKNEEEILEQMAESYDSLADCPY